MKNSVTLLFLIFTSLLSFGENILVDIPTNVFAPNTKTDFENVFIKEKSLKKEVNLLFNQNILSHEYTKSFKENATFKEYWKHLSKNWCFTDLDKDGNKELIFRGKASSFDEKDYVEIFYKKDSVYISFFRESGVLLGYKIQPNTKEIILIHHKYPCCLNASHNILNIRKIDNKLKLKNNFFAGRDKDDMRGNFFPESIIKNPIYKVLIDTATVYWSQEIITNNAWDKKAKTNEVTQYPTHAVYKLLYKGENMSYVLFSTPPLEIQSTVINALNFKNKGIYCWIENDKIGA